jgi:hypothetical protein
MSFICSHLICTPLDNLHRFDLQLAGRVRSINQAHEEKALAWQVSQKQHVEWLLGCPGQCVTSCYAANKKAFLRASLQVAWH